MTDPKTTGLIHHPYRPPAGFDAPQPGVFKASTVIFANVAAMRARNWREKAGYTYGLGIVDGFLTQATAVFNGLFHDLISGIFFTDGCSAPTGGNV